MLLRMVEEAARASDEKEKYGVRSIRLLNQCYTDSDLQGMYTRSFVDPESTCILSEETARSINRNRNSRWIEQLPGIFADGPAFVAVGALHLCGQEDLLCRLEERGYHIEAVLPTGESAETRALSTF